MSGKRGVTVSLLAAAGAVFYRRWHLRWGATHSEVAMKLPGDDICEEPNFNFTRAITVGARPEEVWPWLVQIGFGRAGWYSYDVLDNLARPSADRIIPEFQNIAVGDWVPMGPGAPNDTTAMRVQAFEPNEWLLWTNKTGSWVWALQPIDDEHTRLVTRGRLRYSWGSPWLISELILMEIGDFPMMRRLLLNVKRRAERLADGRRAHRLGV
ncbi:MAG: hypothetical protein ACXVQ6_03625 [Actinomycetota bacterium]